MPDCKTHVFNPILDCSYHEVFIMVQSNCIYIEIILIIIIQIMTNIFSNTHLVPSSVLIYIIIANIRCVLLGPGPWFNHLSCIISWKPHKNPANGCYYPHFTGEEREVHHRAKITWLNCELEIEPTITQLSPVYRSLSLFTSPSFSCDLSRPPAPVFFLQQAPPLRLGCSPTGRCQYLGACGKDWSRFRLRPHDFRPFSDLFRRSRGSFWEL